MDGNINMIWIFWSLYRSKFILENAHSQGFGKPIFQPFALRNLTKHVVLDQPHHGIGAPWKNPFQTTNNYNRSPETTIKKTSLYTLGCPPSQ